MSRPSFSIAIPTRNRSDTLEYTLRTCLTQKRFDDYEVVINDNGDDDKTQIYIAELFINDAQAAARIKYFRRPTVCSMAENFEQAISRTQGDYIIVLGDDDGLLPMALFEINQLIQDESPKIVKWQNGLYNWPGMMIDDAANYLGFSLVRSKSSKNAREELGRALATFDYTTLPMLYINAAVSREAVSAMRDQEGKLFKSPSPDVYSAIVMAYKNPDFLSVTVPFTLAGLSHHSNGVSSAFDGNNPAPRDDFSALNARGGIHQHGWVPNLSIFPAVAIADSFYHAKIHHFPFDDTVQLSRRHLMQVCVAHADTTVEAVRGELLLACEDDRDLVEFTRDLIAHKTETLPPIRLKPPHLGFDGDNLHLDPRDYGVTTIEDAVALVHKIVWPADAPLRYDQPGGAETRANLGTTINDLELTRRELADRSIKLADTLLDVQQVRETLIERTTRLEAAIAECNRLQSQLKDSERVVA